MKRNALLVAVVTACASCSPLASGRDPAFAAPPSDERCATLSDRASWSSSVAAGAGALAGAGGLASVESDGDTRRALVVTGLAMGAVAAGASLLAHETAAKFTREGCR